MGSRVGAMLVLVAMVVLGAPIWMWRQGVIGSTVATFIGDKDEQTSIRFHDKALADEITAASQQMHMTLWEVNKLVAGGSIDLTKRRAEGPAVRAALEQYEKAIARMHADADKALDERRLEALQEVLDMRKKVADAHGKILDQIDQNDPEAPYMVGSRGERPIVDLREYAEDMNSEIDYLNKQAAEKLKNIGEETSPKTNELAPAVFEVGEFSESYNQARRPAWSPIPPAQSFLPPMAFSHGFIVTPDGIAVMRLGPLMAGPRIQLRLADGRLFTVIYVLAYDVDHDIAIVRIGRPFKEFGNWPDELPNLSLEHEGAARADGSAAIRMEKAVVKANLIPETTLTAPGIFFMNGINDAAAPLDMHACGAPVVNTAGDVIGELCSQWRVYPWASQVPKLQSPTPVVSASVILELLKTDLGMEPKQFNDFMTKRFPEAIPKELVH